MCGIAGIISNQGIVDPLQLDRMLESLFHRGPDGSGQWYNEAQNVALGHRRLAIIDLSAAGAQPRISHNGRYVITFNGEIYNYIELAELLAAKQIQLQSGSDTEVLLEYGIQVGFEKALEDFDGQFAFAIYDKLEKTLFCARDRFGEKPFYYSYIPGKIFAFASEMKALFHLFPKKVNKCMLGNYLMSGLVENIQDKSETFFENIFKLEAGHWLKITDQITISKKQYWSLSLGTFNNESFESACNTFRELFDTSLTRRLRADVPVGSSLSGGLDSSVIVCSIPNLRTHKSFQQHTFSARFKGFAKDEGFFIEKAVARAQVVPHYVWLTAESLIQQLDACFYHQEEPFGSASMLCQFLVMQLAKENNITVLLDGQGADEVISGYKILFLVYFRELYRKSIRQFRIEKAAYEKLQKHRFSFDWRQKICAWWPSLVNKYLTYRYLQVASKWLTADMMDLIRKNNRLIPQHVSLNEAMLFHTTKYDLETLLRYADRNAMAHSREVRLPFLYHKMVEYLFTLPPEYKIRGGWSKAIMRYAMQDRLPEEITWRTDKIGYEPPQSDWMQHPVMQHKVRESISRLQQEKIIRKDKNNFTGMEWSILMAGYLF